MNIFRSTGFVAGVLVGLILVVIIFKLANTNHKVKTEYDERQREIRGKAYMYGFYAIIVWEAVMMALDLAEAALPVEPFVLHFGGIFLGCVVVAGYSIWNGAYWGMNNNRRTYGIVLIVAGLLNAIPVIGSIRAGTFMKAGESSAPVVNLLVLIMLVAIGALLLVRQILDSGADAE